MKNTWVIIILSIFLQTDFAPTEVLDMYIIGNVNDLTNLNTILDFQNFYFTLFTFPFLTKTISRAPLTSWLVFQGFLTFLWLYYYKGSFDLSLLPSYSVGVLFCAIFFHELALPYFFTSSTEIISLSWWILQALSSRNRLYKALNWSIIVLLSVYLAFLNLVWDVCQSSHISAVCYDGAVDPVFWISFFSFSLLICWFEVIKHKSSIRTFSILFLLMVVLMSMLTFGVMGLTTLLQLLENVCYVTDGQFTNLLHNSKNFSLIISQLSPLEAEEAFNTILSGLNSDVQAHFSKKKVFIIDLLSRGCYSKANYEIYDSIQSVLQPVKQTDAVLSQNKIRPYDPTGKAANYLRAFFRK